ncbi:hypothetical protein X777_06537 [Ooceraea biroi]|uniref:Uncharacterized protein n=1 Tax=Ooceraea biroi TaxID=2015173 RepID=A0A026WCQ6_OOCBI|nr:hypothetical protein X777_06537 [Ooceraea biroi]
MSRAARPCDSFNQSLGCVPPGPELTTSDHATEPASPCYTASCQTLADVIPCKPTYHGSTVGFPSRNSESGRPTMLLTFAFTPSGS